MSVGGPALPDILSAGPYSEGQWAADFNSIRGPNVPSISWNPTSGGAFSGEPPTSSMAVDIKAMDFIQRAYMCAPYHDESNKLIMPEMMCFTVNYADPDTGSQQVLTLSKVNQIMHDEWDTFEKSIIEGSYEYNPKNKEFNDLLSKYGELGLNTYHIAMKEDKLDALQKSLEGSTKFGDLKRFHEMALEDDFHWLTVFGVVRHISFAGSVINTLRAVGLETMDMTRHTDHFTQVNVCLAKRGRVANVFGPMTRIMTGSKLWLVLRRKEKPNGGVGSLVVVPDGSNIYDYPLAGDLEFTDRNGKITRGHFWRVGVVLRQGDSNPANISIQQAANLGYFCNERRAYEAHGTLPSMYVAIGFKH